MKRLVPIMAALLALPACGGGDTLPTTPPSPTIRLPAVPGRPAAGYFDLQIDGDRGALLSVAAPQARRIEMHETMSSGKMTSMRPLERIPVRDGERLSFSPGGRHLMLYDLDPALRPGSEIILTFHFERGNPRTLAARVRAAGDGPPH